MKEESKEQLRKLLDTDWREVDEGIIAGAIFFIMLGMGLIFFLIYKLLGVEI